MTLLSDMEALGPEGRAGESIVIASQRVRCSLARAITLVREGHVSVLGVDPDAHGLDRILIRRSDVARAKRYAGQEFVTVNEAGRRLGTNWEGASDLIRAGLLACCLNCGSRTVSQSDIEAFKNQWMTIAHIVSEFGYSSHKPTIMSLLSKQGIAAFAPDPVKMVLYERRNVEPFMHSVMARDLSVLDFEFLHLYELRHFLELDAGGARGLIASGLLPSHRMDDRLVVRTTDAAEFRRTYMSTFEAIRLSGSPNGKRLKADLAAKGIRPVTTTSEHGAVMYRRSHTTDFTAESI